MYILKKVESSCEIELPLVPTFFWIRDIYHAIAVFPDGEVFNCNLNYRLHLNFIHTLNLLQIEPDFEEYEKYWMCYVVDDPIIQSDQNCDLWTLYYLMYREQYPQSDVSSFIKHLGNDRLSMLESFFLSYFKYIKKVYNLIGSDTDIFNR